MEEAIKDRIILILATLTIILFIGTINSCTSSFRQRVAREKEMAARIELEEKMGKFSQEKAVLEEELKKKDKELEDQNSELQATKKALLQEQLVNQSLKEELAKVTKLKEILEEDLKEALIKAKSAKTKN